MYSSIYSKFLFDLYGFCFDKLQFELKKFSKLDNEYNRYYIKIRTILGINPKTIHEELVTTLGSNTPSYPTVVQWAKHFHEGRENVNNDRRTARPLSELTDENIELRREVIRMIHIQLMMRL